MVVGHREVGFLVAIEIGRVDPVRLAPRRQEQPVFGEGAISSTERDQCLGLSVEADRDVGLAVAVEVGADHLVAVLVAKEKGLVRGTPEGPIPVAQQDGQPAAVDLHQVRLPVEVEIRLGEPLALAVDLIPDGAPKRAVSGIEQNKDGGPTAAHRHIGPAVTVVIADHNPRRSQSRGIGDAGLKAPVPIPSKDRYAVGAVAQVRGQQVEPPIAIEIAHRDPDRVIDDVGVGPHGIERRPAEGSVAVAHQDGDLVLLIAVDCCQVEFSVLVEVAGDQHPWGCACAGGKIASRGK